MKNTPFPLTQSNPAIGPTLPPTRPYVAEQKIRETPLISVLSLMDSAVAVMAIHPSVVMKAAPPASRRGMTVNAGVPTSGRQAFAWAARVPSNEFYLLADPLATSGLGLQGAEEDLTREHLDAMMEMLDSAPYDERIIRPFGNRFPSLEALLCPRMFRISGGIFAPEDTRADPTLRERAVVVAEILRPWVVLSHKMDRFNQLDADARAAQRHIAAMLERAAYDMAVTFECALKYATELLVGALSSPIANPKRRAVATYMNNFISKVGVDATTFGNLTPLARSMLARPQVEAGLTHPQENLSDADTLRYEEGLASLGIQKLRDYPALVVLYGSAMGAAPAAGGGRRYEGARKANPLSVRARAQAAIGCSMFASRGEMWRANCMPEPSLVYDRSAGLQLRLAAATTMQITGIVPTAGYEAPRPNLETIMPRGSFARRQTSAGKPTPPSAPLDMLVAMVRSHIDLCVDTAAGEGGAPPPFSFVCCDEVLRMAGEYTVWMTGGGSSFCCAATTLQPQVSETWEKEGTCECGAEIDAGGLMVVTALLRKQAGVDFALLGLTEGERKENT